jgi:surface protein
MFSNSKFNKDISKWNVSNVETMVGMFEKTEFNFDISKWDVSSVKYFNKMFDDCPIKEEYKPKFKKIK